MGRFTVIVAVSCLVLCSCATTTTQRVDGQHFMAKLEQFSGQNMNSAQYCSYLGQGSNKAYLEYGSVLVSVGKVRNVIYWTYLSELSEEAKAKLESLEVERAKLTLKKSTAN